MNEIMTINNISCYEKDGIAYLDLEACARGLGFTKKADSGNEVVHWTRVREYLISFGVVQKCTTGDFIPENIFYRLAMKAKNAAAEKFQALVADEIIPSIRKTGGYTAPNTDPQHQRAEAMLLNARARQASLWYKLGLLLPESNVHKQICASYASEALAGKKVIALPAVEVTYSATEVGKMYGISSAMVGKIANKHGLKTDENGMTVMDKSRYNNKEVPTYRYNQRGAKAIGECLKRT